MTATQLTRLAPDTRVTVRGAGLAEATIVREYDTPLGIGYVVRTDAGSVVAIFARQIEVAR